MTLLDGRTGVLGMLAAGGWHGAWCHGAEFDAGHTGVCSFRILIRLSKS